MHIGSNYLLKNTPYLWLAVSTCSAFEKRNAIV